MSRFSTALILSFVLIVLFPCVHGQIVPKACKGSVGTYNYDLSKLAQAVTTYQTCMDQNQNLYYFQPCQVLGLEDCKNTEPSPGACQRDTRRPPQYHDLGSINTAVFSQLPNANADEGFLLTYTGGEEDRLVDIQFICDKSVTGTGNLQCGNPSEQPGKHYHLIWRTSHACPSTGGDGGDGSDGGGDGSDGGGDGSSGEKKKDDGGISGGWIFIIILSGLTVIYFVGGAIFNKFVRHKEGLEIIPNVEFWLALPGLVKDGILFTYRKIAGLCGRGGYVEA
jgi:uncharacterized membrane protein YgcG